MLHLILYSLCEQGHGLEIVPSFSQRPPSPLQRAGPRWDSGVSSPHYGGATDDNGQQGGFNDRE